MANQNVPNSNPAFDSIYNPSGFDGQVTSDWLRLGGIPEALKKDLIDFSTAGFDEFKVNLKEYIKSVYPDDYTNFVESDLGQMLTELFAYQAAVLSFKADALAQESYISTAKTSEGLVKLLELIGVSLRGPIPAKANAVVTVDDAAYAVTGAVTMNISESGRNIDLVSTRDNLPLSYTLYNVDSNGNIDMQADSIELDSTDFSTDGLTAENLLLLEGKLQTLEGTFLNGSTNQVIRLPLPSVIEGSVVVSSGDGWFSEIDNIWFASAGSKSFQLHYNEDFSCELRFGDGVVGFAPTPAGQYKVMYRTGGGLRGNVTAGAIAGGGTAEFSTDPGQTHPFSYRNNRAGTGGVDAQSLEEARRFGPMWFAAQYRAVTGQDYTAFANRFRSTLGKTGKALAVLRDNGSAGNMIDIFVLQKATENHLERASFEFKNELITYLNQYRMMTDELTIVDGVVRTLDLVTTLYIDKQQKLSSEDVKQRISGLIVDYFSTNVMDFGQPLIISELINYVLGDPGARFFSIENYDNDIYVDFNEILQLNNIEINVQYV
jgi:hypothetical protein